MIDITVGSDKIGSQRLSITTQTDGSLLVKSEADVKVSILWVKVTFFVCLLVVSYLHNFVLGPRAGTLPASTMQDGTPLAGQDPMPAFAPGPGDTVSATLDPAGARGD